MGIYRRIDDGLLTCPAWEGAPLMAPLLWPFLIVSADTYGRMPASAAVLRARMLPYHTDHVSLAEVRDAVHFYADAGMVTVYSVGGREYLEITGWDRHQPDTVQHRRGRGMCPPPGGVVDPGPSQTASQVLVAFRVAAQRDAAPREVEQLEDLVQQYGERDIIAILGRAPGKIKSVAYVRAALKQAPAKPKPAPVDVDEKPTEVPRGLSW